MAGPRPVVALRRQAGLAGSGRASSLPWQQLDMARGGRSGALKRPPEDPYVPCVATPGTCLYISGPERAWTTGDSHVWSQETRNGSRGSGGISRPAGGDGRLTAQAAWSNNSWNVPYGQLYVSAYECNTYLTSCSWYTKVQAATTVAGSWRTSPTPRNLRQRNLVGHPCRGPPARPSRATGRSIGQVRWTKYVSNLVELSGEARPSWTAVGITTEACLTGDGMADTAR